MLVRLYNWKYSSIENMFPELKQFLVKQRYSYDMPLNGIDVSSQEFRKIRDGNYRGSVGRIIKLRPVGYSNLSVDMVFNDQKILERLDYKKLEETRDQLTDLTIYTIPTHVKNEFRQLLGVNDKVVLSRANQVYFGKVTKIISNTCIELLLYPIRNSSRQTIRLNKISGIIKWDESMDFEDMAASLILGL